MLVTQRMGRGGGRGGAGGLGGSRSCAVHVTSRDSVVFRSNVSIASNFSAWLPHGGISVRGRSGYAAYRVHFSSLITSETAHISEAEAFHTSQGTEKPSDTHLSLGLKNGKRVRLVSLWIPRELLFSISPRIPRRLFLLSLGNTLGCELGIQLISLFPFYIISSLLFINRTLSCGLNGLDKCGFNAVIIILHSFIILFVSIIITTLSLISWI